jgi:ribosomal protein L35
VDAFIDRHLHSSTVSPDAIVLQSAEDVIEAATSHALATIKNHNFSAHHLVGALVTKVAPAVRRQVKEDLGLDIRDFGPRLLDYIREKQPEEANYWGGVLSISVSQTIQLAGFTSDGLAIDGSDPLKINDDVRAFARLICLEEATPPLSICLFGEWGSGKSTFMERLQREITDLTKPKQQSTAPATPDAPKAAGEPTFIKDVVQIRFNAWHFADANLWASLTAVFFGQLRRGGYDGGRAADYQVLIGKVAERVRNLEASAVLAEKQVENAKHKSESASKALAVAEEKLAASDLTIASGQLKTQLETIRTGNADKLREVGRRVYRNDLAEDSKAFTAAVVDAASVPGKLALIARVLIGGGWPTYLGIAAVVIVAGLGLGLTLADPTNLATWFQRVAPWGAGAGGFAALGAALWQAIKSAKPILDGAFDYAKAVKDARERLTQEVPAKLQEAKNAADDLAKAEKDLSDIRTPLLANAQRVHADDPATVLRYLLFEDSDVRDYDKHVGIVSRARRSFEQLDAIVSATRMGPQVAEKAGRREKLTKKEQDTLEQWRRLPADKNALRVPDRIVLYIDDLDRCTHEQVYAVLQAIHLLLAFESFVVVVGVDVRWIAGAVTKHYEADIAEVPAQGAKGAPTPDVGRKRAIDYLEKIFQIPFWLDRLKTEPVKGSAKDKSTYEAYVRHLLEKKEAEEKRNVDKRTEATGKEQGDTGSSKGEAKGETSADKPKTPPVQDEAEATAAALASMRLEQAEIDILASAEIGLIASKSPRAVKRMVNVYRIVRARFSGTKLEEFLGQGGTPPLYPIAAFLAAVETGQPVEVADSLYAILKSLRADERLDLVWTQTEPEIASADTLETLLEIKADAPGLQEAIRKVDELCKPGGATVENYLSMARIVRRYSFNKYH